MNIVKPYAMIIEPAPFPSAMASGMNLLRRVEHYARVSHRSEEAQTGDSWEKFIRAVVLQHGDWSVTEHEKVTVEALVDRGITHEWVRHRLFSYTQESTRFVNYEKKMPASFIQPNFYPENHMYHKEAIASWEQAIRNAEFSYRELLGLGVAPQLARSVFPNSLASKIIITGNLRSWRHFFIMRTTKESHPQMREVSIPLLQQFKHTIPLLYDDIEPNARQADNLRLPK